MKVNVLVVGAGIGGLTVAWRLAQRGAAVTLVDRGPPGGEATGAAAGILSAQVEGEGASPFFDLLVAAELRYPEFLAELRAAGSGAVAHRQVGVLQVADSAAGLSALADKLRWKIRPRLPAEVLGPAELRALEPGLSADLVGGVLYTQAGQIDNRALTGALAQAAARAGVDLRRAEVQRLLVEGEAARGVEAAGEQLRADAVVLAAGAWISGLAGSGLAAESLRPVRGQMLRLLGPSPVRRVVFGAGGYVVPRWENDTYVGSTMERVGFDKGLTPEAEATLRARAARLAPALRDAPVGDRWAGLRPATADGLPALGPTPIAGLHLLAGLLRNGILLGPLVGELVADAVLGGTAEIPPDFAAQRLYV